MRNKGCSYAAYLHHITKCSVRFVQMCLENTLIVASPEAIKSLFDQFRGKVRIYFFLIFPNQEKINSEVCVKYRTVYSQISIPGTH